MDFIKYRRSRRVFHPVQGIGTGRKKRNILQRKKITETITMEENARRLIVLIFRVIVMLYRQWMVFMSLVIDLIGQLSCHVIGCKTRKLSCYWLEDS